jgi:hypothetical protein
LNYVLVHIKLNIKKHALSQIAFADFMPSGYEDSLTLSTIN